MFDVPQKDSRISCFNCPREDR